jgi:hypothetical protein
MLTFDFHPLYVVLWIWGLRHCVVRCATGKDGRFPTIYLAVVAPILLVMPFYPRVMTYMLFIAQLLNLALFAVALTHEKQRMRPFAVAAALLALSLYPKAVFAEHWGRINNFRMPFVHTLPDKLAGGNVVFHSKYKYCAAPALSTCRSLESRHAFLFQWLARDIGLEDAFERDPYVLAFDKEEEFQKLLKHQLGDSLAVGAMIDVPRRDEGTGDVPAIGDATFRLRGKSYELILEEASWPYLLYRLRQHGTPDVVEND